MSRAGLTVLAIGINGSQYRELKALLNPRQMKQAEFQAVKRTTAFASREVKKEVREQTTINKKYVDRVVKGRVSRQDPPVGVVTISQQSVPAVAYRHTASKRRGVSFQPRRTKPPIRLRHGFKATARTAKQSSRGFEGHTGLFLRSKHLPTKGPNAGRGSLTPRGFAGRLAIEEVRGPSVLDHVNVPHIQRRILSAIADVLAKNISSQIDRFTKTTTRAA